MNKVILMGRLTRDPEVRYGGQDNQMAIGRFSIAVDRRVRRQDGSQEADFFECTAFGKLGEFVERYLKQGTKVVVTGRLQNDNYTNREGQKVYRVQIMVEEIEFAESKAAQSGNAGQYANRQQGGYQQQAPAQSYQQAAPAQQAPQGGFQQAAPVQQAPEAGFSSDYSADGAGFPEASAETPEGFMNIPDSVDDGELPFN